MPHEIKYRQSTVSYEVYGKGPELLLAFHGYGKDASSLKVLAGYFGDRYTVISIDIFYHGQSEWTEENAPTKKDWQTIINEILKANGNPQKFSVFGYSIGGRLATYTAYIFEERINTLWLMAATGVGSFNDAFYRMAVNTRFGDSLFKSFVKKPGFIFFLISLLGPSLQGFIKRKVDTFEKRQLLYKRWGVLKNLRAPKSLLQAQLIKNNTYVLLVFGKKDSVVKYKNAIRFGKALKNVNLLLPDAGHHLFDEKTMEWVKERAFRE